MDDLNNIDNINNTDNANINANATYLSPSSFVIGDHYNIDALRDLFNKEKRINKDGIEILKIKDYDTLCNIIEAKRISRKETRIAQNADFKKFFSFSRYGKSYLIDIIYESPLLPPKKRKDINARKMSLSDYFKHLITTFFYKKGKDCFKNYTELCDVLYLKHKTGDRQEIQLQKLKNYFDFHFGKYNEIYIDNFFDVPKPNIIPTYKLQKEYFEKQFIVDKNKYNNGGVYAIYNDDYIYFGSTIDLYSRYCQHRQNNNNPFIQHFLLENINDSPTTFFKAIYYSNDEKELREKEIDFINTYIDGRKTKNNNRKFKRKLLNIQKHISKPNIFSNREDYNKKDKTKKKFMEKEYPVLLKISFNENIFEKFKIFAQENNIKYDFIKNSGYYKNKIRRE